MSGWNLPPGVSVGMIPGNRPEDDEAEAFWQALYGRLTPEQGALLDSAPGEWEALIEIVRDVAYEAGRAAEKADTEVVATMSAMELGLTTAALDALLGRERRS